MSDRDDDAIQNGAIEPAEFFGARAAVDAQIAKRHQHRDASFRILMVLAFERAPLDLMCPRPSPGHDVQVDDHAGNKVSIR
ncbi:hypothetical protein D9M69_565730 [compost metagenome]